MKKIVTISLAAVILIVGAFLFLSSTKDETEETEENFKLYKADREAIISMIERGEIQKEPDRAGNEGFYHYYTPEKYIDAVQSETLSVSKYDEETFFVFFQTGERGAFDFSPLTEGFLYSSTGEFPTYKQFNYYGDYKVIDEHWFFISDDEERFKNSCTSLCK